MAKEPDHESAEPKPKQDALNSTPDPPAADQYMDRKLLEACKNADLKLLNHLITCDPSTILRKTPHGNNCLHVAAMLGHEEFAKEVWAREPSLFSDINLDQETPLITAVMAPNASLASNMITAASRLMRRDDLEEGKPFNEMLLKVDRRGENVLFHAMRNGFEDFALELLEIEPRLSEKVNKSEESPMHMAARRGYSGVVERLLRIDGSAHTGPGKMTALTAAVKAGHKDIVEQLLKARPKLAYYEDKDGDTALERAITYNNLELVKIFLEHDPNLAYHRNKKTQETLFSLAATLGNILIVEEMVKTCPDCVYSPNKDGYSALHEAIQHGDNHKFVEYVLRTKQLYRLFNQVTNNGSLPLHHAADKCNPKLLRSLMSYEEQDYTAVNISNKNAVANVKGKTDLWKTLNWIESFTLLTIKIPSGWKHLIGGKTEKKIKKQAMEEIKSLTEKYTTNTSLVAALLATITFAAAFTLPGGFDSNPPDVGLPIFATRAAFQVFLISDSIAMCSSLAAAFLCILASWEDLDFLLNYRKTTKALMWCAYAMTSLAFGTGLYTVLARKCLWLAVLILLLCSILPLLSKIIGEWPLLMLRCRLGRNFRKDILPII